MALGSTDCSTNKQCTATEWRVPISRSIEAACTGRVRDSEWIISDLEALVTLKILDWLGSIHVQVQRKNEIARGKASIT